MNLKLNVTPEVAAKLQAVLADEEFSDALLAMQTPEEVQAALKEKGVELTIEQIKSIATAINNANKEELDEEALEDVAGGAFAINVYWDNKKQRLNVTIVGW